MRNNLRTVFEKIREIKDKTPAQISMMNMLFELIEHSVGGYADMQEQIILFDCGSRLFKGQIEAEFRQGQDALFARLVFPINCSKEKREKVARLCHLMNRTMILGSFEYDPRSGECALRYAHYYGDVAMTRKQVRRAIGIMLSALQRYEKTLISLLTGKEPADKDACREYRMMIDLPAEAPAVKPAAQPTAAEAASDAERSAQPSSAQEAPAEESRSSESREPEANNKPTAEASPAAEQPRSPLAFNVDNDEMIRLFNDSLSASEAGKQRKNEPQPVAGNEADEEREQGGIPIEPEVADAFELEPGQIGIALDDSGEMVGLLTGGASEQEEENAESPVNGETEESTIDNADDVPADADISVSGEGEEAAPDEEAADGGTDTEATGNGGSMFPNMEIDFSFLYEENASDDEEVEDVVISDVQAEPIEAEPIEAESVEADSAEISDGGDAADGNSVHSAQNPSEDEADMEDGVSDDCREDAETTQNDGMSQAPEA